MSKKIIISIVLGILISISFLFISTNNHPKILPAPYGIESCDLYIPTPTRSHGFPLVTDKYQTTGCGYNQIYQWPLLIIDGLFWIAISFIGVEGVSLVFKKIK